jgi:hypothetical protein
MTVTGEELLALGIDGAAILDTCPQRPADPG